jgi:integrative and conjugative element protein (TIGR02256 family)
MPKKLDQIKYLRRMRSEKFLNSRRFAFPHSKQELIVTRKALEIFSTYRQKEDEPEAGGLLFAEFDFPLILVVEASPPNVADKRWRTLFIPNRILQRRLIRQYFDKGLHFIGEWHTHPEPKPTPSRLDLNSMADAFRKSQHELDCFIMTIVGNQMERLELWVSAHNGSEYSRLDETAQRAAV